MDKITGFGNFDTYLGNNRRTEPKKMFKDLAKRIFSEKRSGLDILDIGCADGKFISYLHSIEKNNSYTGIDVLQKFIDIAKNETPEAEFLIKSVEKFPADWADRFDVVSAIGVLSIFDDPLSIIDNMMYATKAGGRIYILTFFNPFPVDAIVRHRKHIKGVPGKFESGFNIHSRELIENHLKAQKAQYDFFAFELPFDDPPKKDPVRAWTMYDDKGEKWFTNGLGYLFKLSILEIRKQ